MTMLIRALRGSGLVIGLATAIGAPRPALGARVAALGGACGATRA